ncbi:MAG: hypothetical protein V8R83_11790 [Candidatus Gastranaerophilaceae bacterium]
MNKKLVPIGNGWSVYMPVHIIKLMGVNPKESKVLFEVDGNILRVNKIDSDDESQNTMLVRKFIRSGNGYALYIPNTILELLEVTPEKDSVSIKMSKQTLIITKAD